jgi:2-succinyl-5-enolpyruvyl-6-hydroxy-3-cyclohexene-1-carboxylate synthase
MITDYKHVRMLLSLLKQYNIKHIIISPGSRNISIAKSVEDDPYFTCYSVVDERSAAYFAIGVSLEVNAPVAITCTSAQATRNYFPGLTEAYYRKIPILAITTDYDECYTGQLNMQSISQMEMPSDTANVSVDIPIIKDANDSLLVNRRLNLALDALTRNGGGPAHVNIRINAHWKKGEDILETARKITRYTPLDGQWPKITAKRILLVVGGHRPFTKKQTTAIEAFTNSYNVAIYVNHISNYNGLKTVHGNKLLMTSNFGDLIPDLVITIGGHLGDYPIDGNLKNNKIEHWRVSHDGLYGDTYNSLTTIFECSEDYFFERIADNMKQPANDEYYLNWKAEIANITIPDELPLSHAHVAKKLSPLIPLKSNLHFAILSSLRNWELNDLDPSIKCYSNVAAFGIDGDLSTFLGQSIVSSELNFLIIGDLAFFYDMNALGIRQLKNNVRIVLVNNSGGGEFRLYTHAANSFGDLSNRHIAAAGHFGTSAEGWVKNNNFEYVPVRSKKNLENALHTFIKPSQKPMLIEVFTSMSDDSYALETAINSNKQVTQSNKIKQTIKDNLPSGLKSGIKKILGR